MAATSSSFAQPDIEVKRNKSKKTLSSQRIPLVHNLPLSASREGGESEEELHRKWLYSSSYDRTTGNPSRQRLSQLWLQTSRESIERYQSIQDVHNLRNDSPTPSPTPTQGNSSSLEERIKARKKERHDDILHSTGQSLSSLGSELREAVEQQCIELKTALGDIEKSHFKLWNDHTDPEVILGLSYNDIEQLWTDSVCYCTNEAEIIKRFELSLIEQEEKHLIKVSKVLSDTLQSLNEVAYLFPHENEDLLDKEALHINLSLLSNRRTYSHLCRSLVKCNQQRTHNSRCNYETLCNEWRGVKLKFLVDRFSHFIEAISHSSILSSLKDSCVKEQETIKHQITTHFNILQHFSPVQGSKVKIYEWKVKFEQFYETLVSKQLKFLSSWSDAHRDIHHIIQEELGKIQDVLVTGHILEPSESLEFVKGNLHSLVDLHQRTVEEETRIIEKSLSTLTSLILSQFTVLFQYAQGAAHIWDTHVLKLDEISRNHETQLSMRRKDHDHTNQSMEGNLDYVIDRLRQAGSPEEAGEYCKQSLQMLEKIKANYHLFHESMLSTSNKLPLIVKRELAEYDKELCLYFGVSRSPPSTAKTDKMLVGHTRRSRRPSINKTLDTTQATPTPVEELFQLIATSEGTSFYILSSSTGAVPHHRKEEGKGNVTTFLTQDEDLESKMDTFITSSLTIDQSLFTDIKDKFRLCFLNHLERWRRSKLLEAEKEIQDKEGEFITELELRLHLHQPRPQRVKEDIYQIRTGELEAHEERIGSHVRGVTNELHSQKEIINNLPTLTDEKIAQFVTDLSQIHSLLSSCDSTTSLTRITEKATSLYTKSLELCHQMYFQIEESILDKLGQVSTANGNYVTSLKLFSQGGNYSNNEIDRYRPRLLKQSDRINKYREQLMDELQSAKDTLSQKFEQAYKKHFKNDMEYYVMDLNMLDNFNQTLTNCQVQIKTEVALSNGQCKDIADQMSAIKGQMNNISLSFVLSSLPSLYQSCHDRVKYLYCYNKKKRRKDSTPTTTPLTQAPPISAIEVTKSILSYTSGHVSEDGTTKIKAITDITRQQQRKPFIPIKRKNSTLQDRKCIDLGTEGGEDETESFLPKIRVILTSTYKKLYAMAEDYYRVKGSRFITQPNQLPETFKQCIDDLIARCHGYYTQAESYRTKCIDELSVQLKDIGQLMEELPVVILVGVANECRHKCDEKLHEILDHFNESTALLEERKVSNSSALRPSLGHPDCANDMNELCKGETDRHTAMETAVRDKTNKTKNTLQDTCKQFLHSVQETVTELLSLYDTCVDQEDILPHTPAIPTQYQLMKEYVHGGRRDYNREGTVVKEETFHTVYPSPTPSPSSSSSAKSRYMWMGIEDTALTFGDMTLEKIIKEKLKSHKVTVGHKAVIKGRDEIIESYKSWYSESIDEQVQWEQSQLDKEHRHYTAWEDSVIAIKQLYNTTTTTCSS